MTKLGSKRETETAQTMPLRRQQSSQKSSARVRPKTATGPSQGLCVRVKKGTTSGRGDEGDRVLRCSMLCEGGGEGGGDDERPGRGAG